MLDQFRGLRIDRERAVKTGALAGLALLGISTLPALLRTPEPPPVPPDVGFRPAEMVGSVNPPGGELKAGEDGTGAKLRNVARARRQAVRKRRAKRQKEARESRARKLKARRARREGQRGPSSPAGGQPTPASSAPPASSSAPPPAPSPAPSPPPSPPSPAPSPPAPSPPPPPDPPGDGSQEFAPR